MKRNNPFIWALIFVFFSGMSGIPRTAYAETVKIGGTGFALGVIQLLATSFENQFPEERLKFFRV